MTPKKRLNWLMPKWTPEADEKLTELVEKGELTMREIGSELGVSKNAVIGRAHRIGADGPRMHGPRVEQSTLTTRLAALDVFPEREHCVFPIGDPGHEGFCFCAAPTTFVERDGEFVRAPYCAEHHKKTHISHKVSEAMRAAAMTRWASPEARAEQAEQGRRNFMVRQGKA